MFIICDTSCSYDWSSLKLYQHMTAQCNNEMTYVGAKVIFQLLKVKTYNNCMRQAENKLFH